MIFFFVLAATGILISAYRIGRGHTYFQLIRKDVKSGRKESATILAEMKGMGHGNK